jgi:hypothetical protein
VPILFTQANYAQSGLFTGSGTLSCAYTNPNFKGNIGIVWTSGPLASGDSIPGTLTDTCGNAWFLVNAIKSNLGCESLWVCPSLIGGINTVTTSVLTFAPSGEPTLVVLEYQPSGCYPCNIGFQGFNPNYQGDYHGPFTVLNSQYIASRKPWFHTLIATIYDEYNSAEATARTWTMTPNVERISFGLRLQFAAPVGYNSGAVADCTVPYPYTNNSVEFDPSPSSPALPTGGTKLLGILISTSS